ncbi:MAG: hypothetical protein ABJA66_10445 [Actinomycetota bacterium]
MKKLILSGLFTLLFICSANVYGQVVPPGASDKNLDDRNIKDRSIEMDKIKRDAEKADSNKQQSNQVAELKFKEIKEDFEKIQMMQNANITIYTKSKKIDYAKISGNADEISKSGMRLKVNLFALPEETKDSKKSKEKKKESKLTEETKTPEQPLPTDVKMLIVEIDNTLAAFVGNPMFVNPKVVNSADNIKAKMDLERLIKLSSALNQEAGKMSKVSK